MTRRILLILFILIAAIYGGMEAFRGDRDVIAPSTAALSVTVVSPQQGTISQKLDVTGTTIPREEIVAITELSGVRVKDVYADVGDSVSKGQKLAVLDGESLHHQLTELQSDYERARDEFTRVDAIKNSGAVSRESVAEKRARMKSAQARLEDARLNLNRSTIIAPEAGVIFERNAAVGALVNASEPLFRIAQKGQIEVEAHVPEADLHNLSIGQHVELHLMGDAESIHGRIRLIAPRIDSASRTASIRISLPNDRKRPVGLFSHASISIKETQGILLPATAIQQDSGGSFVWALDAASKAARLPVRMTLRDADAVIVEDIAADIAVIARAGTFVKEGDIVNVVEDK